MSPLLPFWTLLSCPFCVFIINSSVEVNVISFQWSSLWWFLLFFFETLPCCVAQGGFELKPSFLYLLGARITRVFVSRGCAITLSIYTKEIEGPRYLVMFSQEDFYALIVYRISTLQPKMGLVRSRSGAWDPDPKTLENPQKGFLGPRNRLRQTT